MLQPPRKDLLRNTSNCKSWLVSIKSTRIAELSCLNESLELGTGCRGHDFVIKRSWVQILTGARLIFSEVSFSISFPLYSVVYAQTDPSLRCHTTDFSIERCLAMQLGSTPSLMCSEWVKITWIFRTLVWAQYSVFGPFKSEPGLAPSLQNFRGVFRWNRLERRSRKTKMATKVFLRFCRLDFRQGPLLLSSIPYL